MTILRGRVDEISQNFNRDRKHKNVDEKQKMEIQNGRGVKWKLH